MLETVGRTGPKTNFVDGRELLCFRFKSIVVVDDWKGV